LIIDVVPYNTQNRKKKKKDYDVHEKNGQEHKRRENKLHDNNYKRDIG